MTTFELPRFTPWTVPDRRYGNDAMLARVAQEAPRVPWDVFVTRHFKWGDGITADAEHIALIGPTGQGKTTLLMNLLPLHPYVVVFATKPRDTSMDRLINQGYLRMDRWASIPASRFPRRVLWPNAREIDSQETQRAVFHEAFSMIYREGFWTLAIDELFYIANELKLGSDVVLFLTQARSLGISLVVASQRPAKIPLEVYDQSTHLFFWRDNDERNLSRLSGISWRSADLIRYLIANLDEYQVLYVNTRTGAMVRTKAPAPTPVRQGRR